MGKEEFKRHLYSEKSNIHTITDENLFSAIACKGFNSIFDQKTLIYTHKNIHNINGSYGQDHSATIQNFDGQKYRVHFVSDLDNRGVIVTDFENKRVITKVVLRDRAHDGTPSATPPLYLNEINGIPTSKAPQRSKEIGYTTWSYSNPGDVVPTNTRMVELSIVSSDPHKLLLDRLIKKNGLFVNAYKLAQFIDDPFSLIPRGIHLNEDSVNMWWRYWYQVVERGLRKKEIPQPGQTSQRGFEGFFANSTQIAENSARNAGYTHLSAVPTWTYVWHAFIEKGYLPIDRAQSAEVSGFMKRIASIILPDDETNCSALSPKNPIISWLSVAPFMLELNLEFTPHLGIDTERETKFLKLFTRLKNAVQCNNEVKTYPLSPGRNLWLAKQLC